MRAKEFITEYVKFDKNLFLSRWASENYSYKDEIGPNGENFSSWLAQYDPTQDKKYVNWMIIKYLKGNINRLEDIPTRTAPALDLYMRLSRTKKLKPEHADINRIADLESVVDQYNTEPVLSQTEKSVAEEQSMFSNRDAKLLYNDAQYKIVVPLTHTGSCYFGVNTKWCTASTKNVNQSKQTFNEYSKSGPLYIILHKPTNTRWQFHFFREQFMDEQDQKINVCQFFKIHLAVYQVFNKLGLVKANKNFTQFKIGDSYYNDSGQRHREDGPAVERADGGKEWWINGKRHREDAPAIESADGGKEWYINGSQNRVDGPAVERADGSQEWWVNGKRHRLDGPAIEYADGSQEWWRNGKLHRTGAPALDWVGGTKEWYINGKLHREDGPAIEWSNGTKEWWLKGTQVKPFGPPGD